MGVLVKCVLHDDMLQIGRLQLLFAACAVDTFHFLVFCQLMAIIICYEHKDILKEKCGNGFGCV